MNRNRHRSLKQLSDYVKIIAFLLILSIMAKPVLKIIYHVMDIKMEVYEAFESDDSEEKEFSDDDIEKNTHELYTFSSNETEFFANQVHSTILIHKHFKDYIPDILIPPPEFS